MRIVISGITGFLGSNLGAYFLARGFEVVGVKRKNSNLNRVAEFSLNPKFLLVDSDGIESIFKMPVDFVIHTATKYGRALEDLKAIEEANVELPFALWQLSQKNGIAAFLNTDTFMSTETPKDDKYYNYVSTKKKFLAKAKKILELGETKFINMVVFHMYGPNDNAEKFLPVIIKRMVGNEPEIGLTSGEQKRDFIYISDVLGAFGAAVDRAAGFSKYEEFNIGTGMAFSIKQAVETLREVLASKSRLAWGALPSRQHDQVYGPADVSINNQLDWNFKVSFEEGLKKTAEFYKK